MKLYKHQIEALEKTRNKNRVAYYYDCGLGKTFIGSEKMKELDNDINLLVCQKSKVKDWIEHFKKYYPEYWIKDLTKENSKYVSSKYANEGDPELDKSILVINYDIVYRRPYLKKLSKFTLILDESSVIANEKTKRSKAIMKLKFDNIILLSGTPVSGKYEKLYSQCRLLGWNISKQEFYYRYIVTRDFQRPNMPFPIKIVVGYRNVEDLKDNLRKYGALFKKSEEVLDLPEQNFITINCEETIAYRKFCKNRIVTINNKELVGDTSLLKMLYERQLCSQYNPNKIQAFKDLLNDTDDRLIVFYNFNEELTELLKCVGDRPVSIINGQTKDLKAYEEENNSITFIQPQAGAKGLNLQKANKTIYFSLMLSCENWIQSLARTWRIGQNRPCFYYILETENSIDGKILEALKKGENYTNKLFE